MNSTKKLTIAFNPGDPVLNMMDTMLKKLPGMTPKEIFKIAFSKFYTTENVIDLDTTTDPELLKLKQALDEAEAEDDGTRYDHDELLAEIKEEYGYDFL